MYITLLTAAFAPQDTFIRVKLDRTKLKLTIKKGGKQL